jgi:hypothetical protein
MHRIDFNYPNRCVDSWWGCDQLEGRWSRNPPRSLPIGLIVFCSEKLGLMATSPIAPEVTDVI